MSRRESLIGHLVSRFLAWKLPADFNPDGGISFTKTTNPGTTFAYTYEPVGTNLFTAVQAEKMFRQLLADVVLDEPEPPKAKPGLLTIHDLTSQTGGCPYCGNTHTGLCYRIKSVKVTDYGVVTSIEFFSLAEMNPPVFPVDGPRPPYTIT